MDRKKKARKLITVKKEEDQTYAGFTLQILQQIGICGCWNQLLPWIVIIGSLSFLNGVFPHKKIESMFPHLQTVKIVKVLSDVIRRETDKISIIGDSFFLVRDSMTCQDLVLLLLCGIRVHVGSDSVHKTSFGSTLLDRYHPEPRHVEASVASPFPHRTLPLSLRQLHVHCWEDR